MAEPSFDRQVANCASMLGVYPTRSTMTSEAVGRITEASLQWVGSSLDATFNNAMESNVNGLLVLYSVLVIEAMPVEIHKEQRLSCQVMSS